MNRINTSKISKDIEDKISVKTIINHSQRGFSAVTPPYIHFDKDIMSYFFS
jgi:hypothetical protein